MFALCSIYVRIRDETVTGASPFPLVATAKRRIDPASGSELPQSPQELHQEAQEPPPQEAPQSSPCDSYGEPLQ